MVKEREYEGALALVESLTDFDEALKVAVLLRIFILHMLTLLLVDSRQRRWTG